MIIFTLLTMFVKDTETTEVLLPTAYSTKGKKQKERYKIITKIHKRDQVQIIDLFINYCSNYLHHWMFIVALINFFCELLRSTKIYFTKVELFDQNRFHRNVSFVLFIRTRFVVNKSPSSRGSVHCY